MIANWIPLEEPAGGPNFFHFEPNIRYEFNVDSNGDGVEDYVYRLDVHAQRPQRHRHVPPEHRARCPRRPTRTSTSTTPTPSPSASGPSPGQTDCTTLGADLLEAPNNVGLQVLPRRLRQGLRASRRPCTRSTSDTKVFAGPRAEGFYVDLGMIFDLINFRPGTLPGDHGGGVNTTAGYNVHTIAISVPIQNLTNERHGADGPGRSQRDREHVVLDLAARRRRRSRRRRAAGRSAATGSRSRASATRSSTRSSSRSD